MRNNLWEKISYLADIKYIISGNIFEYDISKANINMLKAFNIISDQEYENFLRMDKNSREVIMGQRIKAENKNKCSITSDTIKNGIEIAKKKFILDNKIPDKDIIRIANDAIYVRSFTGNPVPFTDFFVNEKNPYHRIVFNIKGHYSSMIRFNSNILVFFNTDSEGNYIVDVKGINDNLLQFHEPFLSFICNIIKSLEYGDQKSTLYLFNNFYEDYVNLRLGIDYYREF